MVGKPAHTKRVVIELDCSLLMHSVFPPNQLSEKDFDVNGMIVRPFQNVELNGDPLAYEDTDSQLHSPDYAFDTTLAALAQTEPCQINATALRAFFARLGVEDNFQQNFILFCLRQSSGKTEAKPREASGQFYFSLAQLAQGICQQVMTEITNHTPCRLDPKTVSFGNFELNDGVVTFDFKQKITCPDLVSGDDKSLAQFSVKICLDVAKKQVSFRGARIELEKECNIKVLKVQDGKRKTQQYNFVESIRTWLQRRGFAPTIDEDEERYIIQTAKVVQAKTEIAKLQWQAFRIRCQNGGKAEADRLDSICDAAHQALTVLPSFWTPEGQKPEEILQVAISTVVEHGESFDYINISPKIKIPRVLPEGNVASQLEKPGFVKILNDLPTDRVRMIEDSAYILTSLGGSRAMVSDVSTSALGTIKHIKVREGGEQFLAEKLEQVDLPRWSASQRVTVALNTESSAFALRALKTSRWGNVFGRSTSNEVTAKELLALLEKFSDDQSVVSHILANRGQGSFWSFNWLMPAGRNFWKVIRDDEKAMDRLLDLAALHPTINNAILENGEIDWYLKKSIDQFSQAFETARRNKNQAKMQEMLKRPAFRFLMNVEGNALSPAWFSKYDQAAFCKILNQAGLDPVLLCQENKDYFHLMPILKKLIPHLEPNSIEIPEGTELSPQLIELFGAEEEVYAASLEDTNSILSKIQEGSRTRLRAQYFRSAAPEEVTGGERFDSPLDRTLSPLIDDDGFLVRTPLSPLVPEGGGIGGASTLFGHSAAAAVRGNSPTTNGVGGGVSLMPRSGVLVGGPDRRP